MLRKLSTSPESADFPQEDLLELARATGVDHEQFESQKIRIVEVIRSIGVAKINEIFEKLESEGLLTILPLCLSIELLKESDIQLDLRGQVFQTMQQMLVLKGREALAIFKLRITEEMAGEGMYCKKRPNKKQLHEAIDRHHLALVEESGIFTMYTLLHEPSFYRGFCDSLQELINGKITSEETAVDVEIQQQTSVALGTAFYIDNEYRAAEAFSQWLFFVQAGADTPLVEIWRAYIKRRYEIDFSDDDGDCADDLTYMLSVQHDIRNMLSCWVRINRVLLSDRDGVLTRAFINFFGGLDQVPTPLRVNLELLWSSENTESQAEKFTVETREKVEVALLPNGTVAEFFYEESEYLQLAENFDQAEATLELASKLWEQEKVSGELPEVAWFVALFRIKGWEDAWLYITDAHLVAVGITDPGEQRKFRARLSVVMAEIFDNEFAKNAETWSAAAENGGEGLGGAMWEYYEFINKWGVANLCIMASQKTLSHESIQARNVILMDEGGRKLDKAKVKMAEHILGGMTEQSGGLNPATTLMTFHDGVLEAYPEAVAHSALKWIYLVTVNTDPVLLKGIRHEFKQRPEWQEIIKQWIRNSREELDSSPELRDAVARLFFIGNKLVNWLKGCFWLERLIREDRKQKQAAAKKDSPEIVERKLPMKISKISDVGALFESGGVVEVRVENWDEESGGPNFRFGVKRNGQEVPLNPEVSITGEGHERIFRISKTELLELPGEYEFEFGLYLIEGDPTLQSISHRVEAPVLSAETTDFESALFGKEEALPIQTQNMPRVSDARLRYGLFREGQVIARDVIVPYTDDGFQCAFEKKERIPGKYRIEYRCELGESWNSQAQSIEVEVPFPKPEIAPEIDEIIEFLNDPTQSELECIVSYPAPEFSGASLRLQSSLGGNLVMPLPSTDSEFLLRKEDLIPAGSSPGSVSLSLSLDDRGRTAVRTQPISKDFEYSSTIIKGRELPSPELDKESIRNHLESGEGPTVTIQPTNIPQWPNVGAEHFGLTMRVRQDSRYVLTQQKLQRVDQTESFLLPLEQIHQLPPGSYTCDIWFCMDGEMQLANRNGIRSTSIYFDIPEPPEEAPPELNAKDELIGALMLLSGENTVTIRNISGSEGSRIVTLDMGPWAEDQAIASHLSEGACILVQKEGRWELEAFPGTIIEIDLDKPIRTFLEKQIGETLEQKISVAFGEDHVDMAPETLDAQHYRLTSRDENPEYWPWWQKNRVFWSASVSLLQGVMCQRINNGGSNGISVRCYQNEQKRTRLGGIELTMEIPPTTYTVTLDFPSANEHTLTIEPAVDPSGPLHAAFEKSARVMCQRLTCLARECARYEDGTALASEAREGGGTKEGTRQKGVLLDALEKDPANTSIEVIHLNRADAGGDPQIETMTLAQLMKLGEDPLNLKTCVVCFSSTGDSVTAVGKGEYDGISFRRAVGTKRRREILLSKARKSLGFTDDHDRTAFSTAGKIPSRAHRMFQRYFANHWLGKFLALDFINGLRKHLEGEDLEHLEIKIIQALGLPADYVELGDRVDESGDSPVFTSKGVRAFKAYAVTQSAYTDMNDTESENGFVQGMITVFQSGKIREEDEEEIRVPLRYDFYPNMPLGEFLSEPQVAGAIEKLSG